MTDTVQLGPGEKMERTGKEREENTLKRGGLAWSNVTDVKEGVRSSY